MSHGAITEAIDRVGPRGELKFTLADIPFDELLLHLHTARFTGLVEVGAGDDRDRVFLREGSVVGLRPPAASDRSSLREGLLALKLMAPDAIDAVTDGARDGLQMGEKLVESGRVTADELDRAVEEQARRRLFSVYDRAEAPVRLAEGLDRLAHFHAVYVDVRPAIAFGMVVRSGPGRKQAMLQKVRNKSVRLVAPYDETRNGYGLPPPVLLALRELAEGVTMNGDIGLPGLSSSETAGVLLLFDRMSLLKIG